MILMDLRKLRTFFLLTVQLGVWWRCNDQTFNFIQAFPLPGPFSTIELGEAGCSGGILGVIKWDPILGGMVILIDFL